MQTTTTYLVSNTFRSDIKENRLRDPSKVTDEEKRWVVESNYPPLALRVDL